MTATAVRNYRESQKNLSRLAERDLRAFWASLDHFNPLQAVAALEAFLPEVIAAYGDVGAAAAADYYMEIREESGVAKAHRVQVASPTPREQSVISTKWAVGPIFSQEPNPIAALTNLIDITDRLIKKPGRDTLVTNIQRDPVRARYARVPTGAETCTFCLMLASRGADYLTEASAEAATKYHNLCNCVVTPVWSDDDYDRLQEETGYDPDSLYERWQDALEAEKAAKE